MGKKSINSAKYTRKAEYLLIVITAFVLYFCFREKLPEKNEEETETTETKISDETGNEAEITGDPAVYFDGSVAEIVKKMIGTAEKTVYAATYTYSRNEITELLEKQAEKGVKIRLAAGKNKEKYVPDHDFSLVEMPGGIYHPKFFVFDGRDVLVLSANISSDRSAFNNAVLFRNAPEAAAILEDEIDAVFEGKIEKRCENGCSTEIGTIFFNPGKACVSIRDEFLNAESSIKAAVYTVTQKNPVITGLKKAVRNGIRTSIIVDNWKGNDGKTVNKKAFRYLESIGAELRYDEAEAENERTFHHKFAKIDEKTTVFGSMNWTSSACYRNREIVVISHDETIAKAFSDYFDSFK